MKINKICDSCRSVFWVEDSVYRAFCPSCGRKNYISGNQSHGSKTVHRALLVRGIRGSPILTDFSGVIERDPVGKKPLSVQRKNTSKPLSVQRELAENWKKERGNKMDIVQKMTALGQEIFDCLNYIKEQKRLLDAFIKEKKAKMDQDAEGIKEDLKKEVTEGLAEIAKTLDTIREANTKSIKKIGARLEKLELFSGDHLAKHKVYGAKMAEAPAIKKPEVPASKDKPEVTAR